VRCHPLGKSTMAHPARPRTSSNNLGHYTHFHRSQRIHNPFDWTLQHRIGDQGLAQVLEVPVWEQVQGSEAPAGRSARSSHQHNATRAVRSADNPNGNSSVCGCWQNYLEASPDLARDHLFPHGTIQCSLPSRNRRRESCVARNGTMKMLACNPDLSGNLDAPDSSGLERHYTTRCPSESSPPSQRGHLELACNPG